MSSHSPIACTEQKIAISFPTGTAHIWKWLQGKQYDFAAVYYTHKHRNTQMVYFVHPMKMITKLQKYSLVVVTSVLIFVN